MHQVGPILNKVIHTGTLNNYLVSLFIHVHIVIRS